MSCLPIEPYTVLECPPYEPKAYAEILPHGCALYFGKRLMKWYDNPHYEKWKRGRPTKEAIAKRLRAENWYPEEWNVMGHADGSHHVELIPAQSPNLAE